MLKTRNSVRTHAAVVLGALCIVTTGCTSSLISKEAWGGVDLNIEQTRPVYISWARSAVEDDQVHVWGKVRHPGRSGTNAISGHVDITVMDANGQVRTEADLPLRLLMRPRETAREATFSAKLPFASCENCVIHLRYSNERTAADR